MVCCSQRKGVFPCVGGQKRGGLCFPLCLLGPNEGCFPLCWGQKRGAHCFPISVCWGQKRGVHCFTPSVFVGAKRGVVSVLPCLCLLGAKEGCSLFSPVFAGAKRGVFTVLPCQCLLGPKEGCSLFYPVCVCWGQKRGVHCFILCVCWGPKRGVHCFTLSVFVGVKRGVFTVLPSLCLLGPKEGWSLFFPVYWHQKRGGLCFTLSIGAKRGVAFNMGTTVFHCLCLWVPGKACQESGEKFKPRGGRRHQANPVRQGDHSSSDGSDAGFWQTDSENEADHDDGLSDLYPSKALLD